MYRYLLLGLHLNHFISIIVDKTVMSYPCLRSMVYCLFVRAPSLYIMCPVSIYTSLQNAKGNTLINCRYSYIGNNNYYMIKAQKPGFFVVQSRNAFMFILKYILLTCTLCLMPITRRVNLFSTSLSVNAPTIVCPPLTEHDKSMFVEIYERCTEIQ